MRRLLASATIVALGLSVTAYADDARSFTQEQLRADAHKQQRATAVDDNLIPLAAVSDKPCADGLAGDTQFECSGVDLLSFVPQETFGGSDPGGPLGADGSLSGGGVSDIWGWVDPGAEDGTGKGDEYVMLGKTNGVALFRVTDPLNPEFLGQIPNASPNQEVWHDIKVYEDHAFIVSESALHGVNVFDLTRLRGAEPQATWEPDTNYPMNFAAHNIAINEETGYAYAVGSNIGLVVPDACLANLHIIDIRDPKNPTFAGCSLTEEGGGLLGLGAVLPTSPANYIHDTQCVVYRGPDADYQGRELCFNSSEDFMSIVDVTDKLAVTQVTRVEYPGTAYAHQGWLTEDQGYFMMGDELDETGAQQTRTLVFDVRDLDNATFVGENLGETTAIDHNMYTLNGLVYQSNYTAGLRVLDTADVANANLPQVAFFDTFPAHDDATFNGTWSNFPYFPSGTIAVSGIDEGLFLLKVQDSVLDQFETVAPVTTDASAFGQATAAQNKGRANG